MPLLRWRRKVRCFLIVRHVGIGKVLECVGRSKCRYLHVLEESSIRSKRRCLQNFNPCIGHRPETWEEQGARITACDTHLSAVETADSARQSLFQALDTEHRGRKTGWRHFPWLRTIEAHRMLLLYLKPESLTQAYNNSAHVTWISARSRCFSVPPSSLS